MQTIKRIVLNEYDERMKRQQQRARLAAAADGTGGLRSALRTCSVTPADGLTMPDEQMEVDYGVDKSELVPMPFDAPSVGSRG